MASQLLVETESFNDKGGWKLDQQFVHEMGSPYLLAHGFGKPVAPATTSASIPATATYRVWVRSKNWVSGPWEAPGRFQLAIGGDVLENVFGRREGWGWEDGGTLDLRKGMTKFELRDLTGFDGRCDAIFLTTDLDFSPPNERAALRAWRNQMLGLPTAPQASRTFDLVIVGGGISGCAAALAACQRGLQVALVHDRPVLGGNASGEIRVHTEGIHGYGGEILKKIDTKHWPNGSADALLDDRKRQQAMENCDGLELFLNWRAYSVDCEDEVIQAVNARHTETGELLKLAAPTFIDSTGDGWIGYWAGAEFRYGRESRDEFNEEWKRWGDLWSPKTPDNRVMGSSLLWYSRQTETASAFPVLPWASAVAGGHAAVKGEWYWEYSSNDFHAIDDAEVIRDHMLRAIYGSFANAKKDPKYANYELDWVGYLSGKRESRRLLGDHLYTMQDAVNQRYFPDTVVNETRAIDVHYQKCLKEEGGKESPDFLSTALFHRVGRYYIPFRCLYSKNIGNLMMAGRNFSCSHVGLGGPRVMLTCGQMGIATGYAAALCKKYGTTPRGVYQKHIRELQDLVGEPKTPPAPKDRSLERTTQGEHFFKTLPEKLRKLPRLTIARGDTGQPAPGYRFTINLPCTLYLAVHQRGETEIPAPWKKTDLSAEWSGHRDLIYICEASAGTVEIPPHTGKTGKFYGLPHLVFFEAKGEGEGKGELKLGNLPDSLDPKLVR